MEDRDAGIAMLLERIQDEGRCSARMYRHDPAAVRCARLQYPIKYGALHIHAVAMCEAAIKADFPDIAGFRQKTAQEGHLTVALRHQFWVKAEGHPHTLSGADELSSSAPRLGCRRHCQDVGSAGVDAFEYCTRIMI